MRPGGAWPKSYPARSGQGKQNEPAIALKYRLKFAWRYAPGDADSD